jgi:hypothetical protein
VSYRIELSERVLGQLDKFPVLDALVGTLAGVSEYPDDPLRTLPTPDPYQRRAIFGKYGLVTYAINDATRTVTVLDVTWTG